MPRLDTAFLIKASKSMPERLGEVEKLRPQKAEQSLRTESFFQHPKSKNIITGRPSSSSKTNICIPKNTAGQGHRPINSTLSAAMFAALEADLLKKQAIAEAAEEQKKIEDNKIKSVVLWVMAVDFRSSAELKENNIQTAVKTTGWRVKSNEEKARHLPNTFEKVAAAAKIYQPLLVWQGEKVYICSYSNTNSELELLPESQIDPKPEILPVFTEITAELENLSLTAEDVKGKTAPTELKINILYEKISPELAKLFFPPPKPTNILPEKPVEPPPRRPTIMIPAGYLTLKRNLTTIDEILNEYQEHLTSSFIGQELISAKQEIISTLLAAMFVLKRDLFFTTNSVSTEPKVPENLLLSIKGLRQQLNTSQTTLAKTRNCLTFWITKSEGAKVWTKIDQLCNEIEIAINPSICIKMPN